jgi:hypothetical protein
MAGERQGSTELLAETPPSHSADLKARRSIGRSGEILIDDAALGAGPARPASAIRPVALTASRRQRSPQP